MEILVMDALRAREFIPQKKTGAIRIFSRNPKLNEDHGTLQPHPNYLSVKEYTFDDTPWCSSISSLYEHAKSTEDEDLQYAFLSRELSDTIVSDFVKIKDSIDALLVHCRHGLNRSPAVAVALNDAFKLDADLQEFYLDESNFRPILYESIYFAALRHVNRIQNK